MGNSRLNILSWACEPVKVIEVFRQHILAGVGSNLLIYRVGFENRHPEVVKVFTEGCPITSISCTSCSNSTSSDGDIHVRALVTSLYCYRELVFNSSIRGTSLGKLDGLYEANSGEIIAGRCLDASCVVYDLNNTALLHDTCEYTDEKKVTSYQGYLPAPDSVTITGSTRSDVLFFVATSSCVSICKLFCGDGQHDNEIHCLYTFCQPKGVIFSVKFYPEFKLILTTSDDRSVSLWNCDFKEADVSQFRPWEWTSVTLHGTLEGHTSRIFNAMLVHDHVVSVGEDSSIVAWSLKDLTRHRVIGSHSGSTIWACAYDPGSGRIYTGGDNGSIYEWNISQSVHTYELTEYCELRPVWFSNSEDNPIRLKSKANLNQDYPRLVKSFDETSSVVTTDSGKIYILDKDSIRYCHQLESWRGYITFSWYPGKEIYVAGTLHGAFSFNKLSRLENESKDLQVGCNSTFYIPKPEKIISTHFITSQELLISTVSSLLMYEVSMNTHSNGTINVEPIPQASIKWAAKQKSNTNCATAWNNVVFVGLDNGKIKSYNRKTGEMLYEFKARHSKYGVGGIIVYEGHLVTGGRDSSLNFFYIEGDFGMKDFDGEEPVTHLKTVPIPFLWVGTLLIYREDLIVCGYDSADFVIYSFRREQIIGRTHCGGAHRAWDFLMSKDGTGFFTHIRNRRVYKVCFHLDQCNTNCIKEGLHLEDINSVTEIYSASETATIVATGSEDGAVKISTFRLEDIGTQSDVPRLGFTKVKTHTVSNHTSAVRCVYYQELTSKKEGFLLSGGGKSELVLTKLYLDGCHLKKYCRLRLFGFEEEVDFRIMDIKSMLLPLTKECDTEVAPDKMILVGFIACSDGTLRIIRYNGRFTFSKIYQKGIGATHCLTTVEILRHESPSELTIFCGTSNGEILAWGIDLGFEASSESFWTLKGIPAIRNYTLAATSITAMTVIPNIVNTIIVIGGDDGSLHRLYVDDFLHGDVQNHLLQSNITNGGIMGLQYSVKQKSGRDCCAVTIHFVSNGKLYKCGTNFDNIRSVRIPIEDGKGITICRQLNYDDTICKPFIAFGKVACNSENWNKEEKDQCFPIVRWTNDDFSVSTSETLKRLVKASSREMEIDDDIDVGLGSDSSTSTDDILEATRQASEGPSTTSSSIEVTSVIDSRGGLVRVHNCLPTTDTDWFACPQCFKGFKHLNSLRDHLEMKHGIMETDDSGEEDDGNNDQFMTLIDRCPEVDLTSYDMGRRLVVLDSPIDGLGLFTGTFLPKGELVIEYTGEVITNIQAARRQYSCENHAVKPFIMKIGKLLWDATAYGNCSKYMNNSCEPNCKAETIEIHGKNRCLIFTTRDIEIGEELTFDYKFTSDILVPCTCQASTCRRFLNCNLGNLLGDEEVAALASSF